MIERYAKNARTIIIYKMENVNKLMVFNIVFELLMEYVPNVKKITILYRDSVFYRSNIWNKILLNIIENVKSKPYQSILMIILYVYKRIILIYYKLK